MEATDPLSALCAADASLRAALGAMLDRYERRGRWTRHITLPMRPGLDDALRLALSGRAIQRVARGLRVDVPRVSEALPDAPRDPSGLDPLAARLYAALGRAPHDERTRARARRDEAEGALGAALAEAGTEPARAWARAELERLAADRSELARAVCPPGGLARLALDVVRVLDAALGQSTPVRIQTFAAKTVGSSKALRPAGDLFRLASAALYEHDADTRALVLAMGEPVSAAAARRDALEARGIYRDEVAASVLCFGPIVYRKGRERFDHVARHARLGESCRLVQHQLRDAVLERPSARRVTIFENLTPYLEYVDALHAERGATEIVLCASGQASWAVVRMVEMCARHALPMRFAGDLDRSGVLILRSLRKRAGARIEPMCMGVPTHRRFASRGQPIAPRELAHLSAMLATDPPTAPCHALLAELARTQRWIEQEAFADECLEKALAA
jgi:hypothetical protein